jgi:hypothetical protein
MMRLQWGSSMHARDIPVVGDLVDSAVAYATTLARIARHPFAFVHTIAFDDPQALQRAFKFIGAAIALGYLIIGPALTRHGFDVSELRFGVVVLMRLLLVTVIYHAAFFVLGFRQPVAKSLILSSYLNGAYFPIFMASMLPGLLTAGPQSFFDPLSQQSGQFSMEEHPQVALGYLLLLVAYPFFFALASAWWAKAFGARVWLSAALLFASVILAGLGNLYVLTWLTRLLL